MFPSSILPALPRLKQQAGLAQAYPFHFLIAMGKWHRHRGPSYRVANQLNVEYNTTMDEITPNILISWSVTALACNGTSKCVFTLVGTMSVLTCAMYMALKVIHT